MRKKTDKQLVTGFWERVEKLAHKELKRQMSRYKKEMGVKLGLICMHYGEDVEAANICLGAAHALDPQNDYARLQTQEMDQIQKTYNDNSMPVD